MYFTDLFVFFVKESSLSHSPFRLISGSGGFLKLGSGDLQPVFRTLEILFEQLDATVEGGKISFSLRWIQKKRLAMSSFVTQRKPNNRN